MASFEIMVVDDDTTILELLDTALSKMGYVVTVTADPSEALEILNEKRFDLLLTDLIMEPLDGFKVLASSKARYPEMPVIVLTGYPGADLVVKALRLNANDYLLKPVELRDLYYAVSSCLEKTALENAYRKNREDLKLFKAVTDFSNEAVAVWDLDGKLIYANPAYMSLFVCSNVEVSELWVDTFLTKKSVEILESEIMPALNKGKGWEGILDSFNSENSYFPLWKRMDVIRNEKGQINYIFGFMHDFTRQKKNAENLTQKQKMEALGTLAGGIAHEFNNILWIIGANAELVSAYLNTGSPGLKNLERLEVACDRAVDLVNQILSFSHQNEYEPRELEIVPILKESLKLFEASIPALIEVKTEIPRNPGTIIFEPSLMHQVLINLFTNAAQAMEGKGGVLEIKLENVFMDEETAAFRDGLVPGEFIKISIRDTGVGIDPSLQPKVFDPFFTTRDAGEGTGMGLAVVQGAVKNHGGFVEVHSELGKGSCFDLFFPKVHKVREKTSRISKNPVSHDVKILLVDDDELVVQSGRSILERFGYRVATEKSGSDALITFRGRPDEFDLVITDMSMPQMSGLDLAEKILKIRNDIPIILFSGYHDIVDEEEIFARGVKGLMKKPIKPQAMFKTIQQVLGKKG